MKHKIIVLLTMSPLATSVLSTGFASDNRSTTAPQPGDNCEFTYKMVYAQPDGCKTGQSSQADSHQQGQPFPQGSQYPSTNSRWTQYSQFARTRSHQQGQFFLQDNQYLSAYPYQQGQPLPQDNQFAQTNSRPQGQFFPQDNQCPKISLSIGLFSRNHPEYHALIMHLRGKSGQDDYNFLQAHSPTDPKGQDIFTLLYQYLKVEFFADSIADTGKIQGAKKHSLRLTRQTSRNTFTGFDLEKRKGDCEEYTSQYCAYVIRFQEKKYIVTINGDNDCLDLTFDLCKGEIIPDEILKEPSLTYCTAINPSNYSKLYRAVNWYSRVMPCTENDHFLKQLHGALETFNTSNDPLKKSSEIIGDAPYSLQDFASNVVSRNTQKPFLLVGPPGTGKTTAIIDMIENIFQDNKDNKVLIISPTYQALYAVLLKIIHDDRTKDCTVGLFQSNMFREVPQELSTYIRPLIYAPNNEDIILVTPLNLSKISFQGSNKVFPLIDEASKLSIVEFLYMQQQIDVGKCLTAPITMIGDDHQLQPFSRRREIDSLSIFSLLVNMHKDTRHLYFLNKSYRFSNPLLGIVQNTFYNGLEIKSGNTDKGTTIAWEETKNSQVSYQNTSRYCPNEAQSVIDQLGVLARNCQKGNSISVISPYKAQLEYIQGHAPKDLKNVEYLTIDSVQGREFGTVLVSLVDSNAPFVNEPDRINVAITRASEEVIIYGVVPLKPGCLHKLYNNIVFPDMNSLF